MTPPDDGWKPEDDKDPQEEFLRKINKILPDPDNPEAPGLSPALLFGINDVQEEKRSLYWAKADRVYRLYMLALTGLIHADKEGGLRSAILEGKLSTGGMADLAVRMEDELEQAFKTKHGPIPPRRPA